MVSSIAVQVTVDGETDSPRFYPNLDDREIQSLENRPQVKPKQRHIDCLLEIIRQGSKRVRPGSCLSRNPPSRELLPTWRKSSAHVTALIGKSRLKNAAGKPPMLKRPVARPGFHRANGPMSEAVPLIFKSTIKKPLERIIIFSLRFTGSTMLSLYPATATSAAETIENGSLNVNQMPTASWAQTISRPTTTFARSLFALRCPRNCIRPAILRNERQRGSTRTRMTTSCIF